MKNKGFTLIELLAVIVILAIIALIATPIILNIINDSRDESKLISAGHYLDGVELALTKSKEEIPDGTYDIMSNGNVCIGIYSDGECSGKNLEVKMDGEYPTSGTITISNGIITNGTSLKYNEGYTINKNGNELKIVGSEQTNTSNYETYVDGRVVYFDVDKGEACGDTVYHEDNSITGYNGLNGSGNQNSCLKFYAFNDDGGETLNLLLDHNTTANLAWNSTGSNASGPAEVITQLKTDTNEWVGTITPANYEYKGTASPYTINYSEYKARLITAQEIAKITGADKLLSWDETSTTSNWYYLDGAKTNDTVPNWNTQVANSTNKSDYYWLFDRTSGCTSYGCKVADSLNYGYWTSSARPSYSNSAWYVFHYGRMNSGSVDDTRLFGVRPVIEVSKSNL